jgi:hypothetical protein
VLEMLSAGNKAPAIARKLKRSTGAVYARINALKKSRSLSLPSECAAFYDRVSCENAPVNLPGKALRD